MDIKLLAVGSRLMGDDGVAIAAAEQLSEALEKQGTQVVLCETDAEYGLSCINEKDSIIILDAALSGRKPGTVWWLHLESAMEAAFGNYPHDMDLISLIKTRKLNTTGILICIEALDVSFRFGLSPELEAQLLNICMEIQKIIDWYRGEYINA